MNVAPERPSRPISSLRIALLTNSLSPHSLPLWEWIQRSVPTFRAFVSGAYDAQHKFPVVQTDIEVTLQRSINCFRFYHKRHGGWEYDDFHLPYDTYQQLQAFHPDVIISGQFGLRTTLSVLYRLRHPGVKLILWATLSCRSEEPRSWVRILLRKWILKRIDTAFVNGKSGESYLRSIGYAGSLTYIPYSIDGRPFEHARYNPSSNVRRLLFTGRLVVQKGLRTFCAILDQWCANNPEMTVRLRFVGEGVEESYLKGLQTQPNLTVEVFPKVSQQELREHYEQTDIFVLPTLSDEWAVVTNEAMSAGVPVLGSIHAQSVLELVREGETGWQFDLLDPVSTYDGFDHALKAPVSQLHIMSDLAKKTAAAFDPSVISERALQCIRSLYMDQTTAASATTRDTTLLPSV